MGGKKDPDNWNELFEEQRKLSPDPARSLREWKLLVAHLSGPLKIFRESFVTGQSIAQAEMPFFWPVDENRCLEGVLDLAFFQPTERKWLILDWKTDRVPPDNEATLRTRYRPQLAAYWKAVREVTKMEAEAAIYSTAAGMLVRYDCDELASEWARLEALAPDQFGFEAKIAPIIPEPPVQMEFADLSNPARRG